MTLAFDLGTVISMCAFLWYCNTKPKMFYWEMNRIAEHYFISKQRVVHIHKHNEGTKSSVEMEMTQH